MASLQQGGALASFLPHGFMGIQAPAGRVPEDAPGAKWTHEEHSKFLRALEDTASGGSDWSAIAAAVGRTEADVKCHAQHYFLKLEHERSVPPANVVPVRLICPHSVSRAFSTDGALLTPNRARPAAQARRKVSWCLTPAAAVLRSIGRRARCGRQRRREYLRQSSVRSSRPILIAGPRYPPPYQTRLPSMWRPTISGCKACCASAGPDSTCTHRIPADARARPRVNSRPMACPGRSRSIAVSWRASSGLERVTGAIFPSTAS